MGGYAAKVTHPNTATDSASALLDTLLDHKDFTRAAGLCREKKMLARDDEGGVRWAKDSAIVEAVQGRYVEALDRLTDVFFVAQKLSGRPRAKYEDEMGLLLVETNRTSHALSHFRLAFDHHRQAGYLRGCAAVRHNAGRAYAVRGEYAKAARYFRRALDYARGADDYRLEREVLESIIEFEGAR